MVIERHVLAKFPPISVGPALPSLVKLLVINCSLPHKGNILWIFLKGEFMQMGSREDPDERFTHYLTKTFKKTASLLAYTCKSVSMHGLSSTIVFIFDSRSDAFRTLRSCTRILVTCSWVQAGGGSVGLGFPIVFPCFEAIRTDTKNVE